MLFTGEVGVSPYIDKNGKPAASLKLTANDVKFLSNKQEMERRGAEHPAAETEYIPF